MFDVDICIGVPNIGKVRDWYLPDRTACSEIAVGNLHVTQNVDVISLVCLCPHVDFIIVFRGISKVGGLIAIHGSKQCLVDLRRVDPFTVCPFAIYVKYNFGLIILHVGLKAFYASDILMVDIVFQTVGRSYQRVHVVAGNFDIDIFLNRRPGTFLGNRNLCPGYALH